METIIENGIETPAAVIRCGCDQCESRVTPGHFQCSYWGGKMADRLAKAGFRREFDGTWQWVRPGRDHLV